MYSSVMDNSPIIAVEPPPPGQVANFVNPYSDGYKIIVVNVVMLLFSSIVTGMRLFTRVYIVKGMGLDDCMLQ